MELLDHLYVNEIRRVRAQRSLKWKIISLNAQVQFTVDKVFAWIEVHSQLGVELVVFQHSVDEFVVFAFGQDYCRSASTLLTILA